MGGWQINASKNRMGALSPELNKFTEVDSVNDLLRGVWGDFFIVRPSVRPSQLLVFEKFRNISKTEQINQKL